MLNELAVEKTEKKIYDILPHEPETIAMALLVIGMGAYYLWRMFAITPQYDELYTYYTFISKGPFYAAIHWPLPNNHVGYSVLSGFVDYFGNSYFGLRGVSFVCAISNLILVYRICKRFFSHGLPFSAALLYASMQVVNEYSVQGRGYTLATLCFLLSIYCICQICSLGEKRMYLYFSLFGVIVLGLYTVPSSVYWVVPVGLSGALYLLINAVRSKSVYDKPSDNIYRKKLINLVFSGLFAAAGTTFLYSVIWLAIGSNLLVKTSGSEFFGWTHGAVLLRSPMKALLTGVDYMLSQPYIQSLEPDVFWQRYLGWNYSMLNYMLPGMVIVLIIFILAGMGCMIYECIKHFEYSRTVINLVAIVNLLFIGVMLILQKKLPYLRVFGYSSFIVVLCVCSVFERLINVHIRIYNRKVSGLSGENAASKENEIISREGKWYFGLGVYIPTICIAVLFLLRVTSSDFNCQLGHRENELFNTLYIADVTKKNNPAVLDCDQQYLMKFGWDIDCTKTDVDGADMVIVDKDMLQSGYSGEDFWKFYQTHETINWDYLKSMRVIYESEDFILYVK